MGNKYTVNWQCNGLCIGWRTKGFKYFVPAILYMAFRRITHPIVNFEVRNGYKKCAGCDELYDCPMQERRNIS